MQGSSQHGNRNLKNMESSHCTNKPSCNYDFLLQFARTWTLHQCNPTSHVPPLVIFWSIKSVAFIYYWVFICSETLNRNWNDTAVSVLPIYKELIAAGLRIWVFRFVAYITIPSFSCLFTTYFVIFCFFFPFLGGFTNFIAGCAWNSGDVDSVVPVTATRFSLAQLRLRTKILWYPWYVKKQVSY